MAKPITCLAAVAWEPNKPLVIEEIEVAPPKKNEVRVRVMASSLCHTDSYVHQGRDPEGVFPVILGHEAAGVVESVGEGTSSVEPGDHVILLYIPECGKCKFCRSGKTNLCSVIRETQGKGLMPDGTSRFTCKGKSLFHFMGISSFSNYTVVPEISLVKVDRAAPFEKICLLGCGATTGYGAVEKVARVEKGAKVAVFGCGCVGLSVIAAAARAGAGMIIGVDTNEVKREWATKFGATHFINPAECGEKSIETTLIEMTFEDGAGGVDYSFDCTGNVKVMRSALEACHKGWGQSIVIGVAGVGECISTLPFQLVTGRVWRGCAFGGVKGRSHLPEYVKRYLNKELRLDELVTTVLPFEKVSEGFEKMHDSNNIKTVLIYR
ncbi:alcohol dehydrogenase class-3-like [Schistocerca gregaria]|uniref:alcohol dehydrogenase class-3-like n=1 Tax=Schistocerca gregaria TaxID=7010 RepID=UPI00211F358E|nr:alcohol dehydrogenase class-3-like [Schistocerca gregaria]